jgi:hypothetical protein
MSHGYMLSLEDLVQIEACITNMIRILKADIRNKKKKVIFYVKETNASSSVSGVYHQASEKDLVFVSQLMSLYGNEFRTLCTILGKKLKQLLYVSDIKGWKIQGSACTEPVSGYGIVIEFE